MSSTGMQSQSTSDDGHSKSLSDLCRICSNIINPEVTCYEVCKFKEQLDTAFNIDCAADSPGIHPPRFCLNCYASIMHSEKGGSVLTYPAATWKPHSSNDCSTCKLRSVKSKGGRPKKKSRNTGRPKSVIDIRNFMKLDVNSAIPSSLQKAASHIIALQAKQSPKQMIELKTGGPNPMRFVPATVARKDTTEVSKRTLRARSRQIKNYSKMVSGGSREGLAAQTAHVVKGMDREEREDILKSVKSLNISIPIEYKAAVLDDPIENILSKYSSHPSIKLINGNVTKGNFSFSEVSLAAVEKEIAALDGKKASMSSSIPPNFLKDDSTIYSKPLTDIINNAILNSNFDKGLKRADLTPAHKADETTNKKTTEI